MIPQPTSSKSISNYRTRQSRQLEAQSPNSSIKMRRTSRICPKTTTDCSVGFTNQLAAEGERWFEHDLPSQLICPEHYCGERGMPVEQNGMPRGIASLFASKSPNCQWLAQSVAVLPDQRYVLTIWRTREEHPDALDALVEFQRAHLPVGERTPVGQGAKRRGEFQWQI